MLKPIAMCCLGLLAMHAAWGQSFKATEGNTYTGQSVDGGRDGGCLWELNIRRTVSVQRDANSGRLTFTMDVQRRREANYRGNNRSAELDCEPGASSNSATVRFYIDGENSTSTRYSGTVIRASGSGPGAFKLGDRIAGDVDVFDGGRGLEFHSEEFMNGSAKLLAAIYRAPAGAEPEYVVPARAPDLVLSCKVISAEGGTTSRNDSTAGHLTGADGRRSSASTTSSGAVSSSACQAFGWEKLRKTVSVWVSEKRCDGYACEIAPSFFKWKSSNLSRVSGQMQDACYTYECEKSTTATRF